MAIVNILLGIGGTGAKLVESAVYLLAAGVAPIDQVIVGLIDQDNSNGNLDRTRTLIESVGTLRDDFDGPGPHLLDRAEAGPPFLHTRIEPLFDDKLHWRPADGDIRNLAEILDRGALGDDERAMFDLLFRPAGNLADEEQTMALREGYRGRAHVGSAALTSALHFDDPSFHDRMLDLMKRSSKGDTIRIFLAGSIFGGTGAAGFPTVARALNDLRHDTTGVTSSNVHIGGVLMLPYFGFGDSKEADANVVRDVDLLPQSKVALEFYNRLFEEDPDRRVFDRFYVAGWNELLPLGYHNPGARDQRNPALAPELIGALAIIDFLAADKVMPMERPLVSARRSASTLGWDDLPGDAALKAGLYDRMGRLLRAAVWWRHRVEPAFDNKSGFGFGAVKAGNVKLPWLKLLVGDLAEKDWQGVTPATRKHLTDYFAGLLT